MQQLWGTPEFSGATYLGTITYIPIYEFQSKTNKTRHYRVSVSNAGVVSCQCRGWTMRAKKLGGGNLFRTCTHVRQVLSGRATIVRGLYQDEFAHLSPTLFVGGKRLIEQQIRELGVILGPDIMKPTPPYVTSPIAAETIVKKPKRQVTDLDTIFNEFG